MLFNHLGIDLMPAIGHCWHCIALCCNYKLSFVDAMRCNAMRPRIDNGMQCHCNVFMLLVVVFEHAHTFWSFRLVDDGLAGRVRPINKLETVSLFGLL